MRPGKCIDSGLPGCFLVGVAAPRREMTQTGDETNASAACRAPSMGIQILATAELVASNYLSTSSHHLSRGDNRSLLFQTWLAQVWVEN